MVVLVVEVAGGRPSSTESLEGVIDDAQAGRKEIATMGHQPEFLHDILEVHCAREPIQRTIQLAFSPLHHDREGKGPPGAGISAILGLRVVETLLAEGLGKMALVTGLLNDSSLLRAVPGIMVVGPRAGLADNALALERGMGDRLATFEKKLLGAESLDTIQLGLELGVFRPRDPIYVYGFFWSN